MNSVDRDIDWDDVRQRIDAVNKAIEKGFTLSPEEDGEVLRARARALGQEPSEADVAGEILDVVEFELAGEHYAFPLKGVLTVSKCGSLTPVPCSPSFVAGITNLRGEIWTVIGLMKFFDLPGGGEFTDSNGIIFLRHQEIRLGILADAVIGVRHIGGERLERSLPTLTGVGAEYLQGITSDRLVVLDPAKILADPNIIVDEEIVQ